jgi:peptidoglycan/xylan/chitin deacetylase (PgdA/CDA1 family)
LSQGKVFKFQKQRKIKPILLSLSFKPQKQRTKKRKQKTENREPSPTPMSLPFNSYPRLALSLFPAFGVLAAILAGWYALAGLLFLVTSVVITVGTLVPRCAWFGPLTSALPAESEGVCLTIDDGPDPEHTPALLDILDQHQAKAIFFLIGDRAARHPELVREIARRGHVIGNHSQTHPAATFWALNPWRMWAEIAVCQQTLTQIIGTRPQWFRPPVGHHNLFVAAPLRALDLKMLMWNCRGYDAVEKDPALVLRRIEKSLRPGAIILLHDATPICKEVLCGTLNLLQRRGLRPQLQID